jgi:hypothetical protein
MALIPEIIARLQPWQFLLEFRDWELVETVSLCFEAIALMTAWSWC